MHYLLPELAYYSMGLPDEKPAQHMAQTQRQEVEDFKASRRGFKSAFTRSANALEEALAADAPLDLGFLAKRL